MFSILFNDAIMKVSKSFFFSVSETVLMNKEANERINIMQSRLNAMRELYCKLRTEVASIDRRRKRKLRKH